MMVILALMPSLLVSIYVFGFRVLTLTLACVVASVFFEWAWNKLMKRPQTVGDLSAVVTGVLIAFNVPSGLPYWIAVRLFVGIVIVNSSLAVSARTSPIRLSRPESCCSCPSLLK